MKFWTIPIRGYQYLSRMLPSNCRYYPSCSEYAAWQFEFNAPHYALAASTLRILRCNQFFAGGIDYPIITFHPPHLSALRVSNANYGKIKILYWLVPKSENRYFILKDLDGNHAPRST